MPVEFPETVLAEWEIVARAANIEAETRKRIERDTRIEAELDKLRIRYAAQQLFEAEQAALDTPDLEMMTLSTYSATAAHQGTNDLIEGVMMDEGLCIMLGPSGSGKSTLGLQTLYCLMTGNDWLGQKVNTTVSSVGALSYDMSGALMADWMTGFPGVDPDKVSIVNAYKAGNPLAVPAHRATIAKVWKAMGVEVVLIDSFSASFFGHDQNDAASTQAHYRDLKRFALSECGARAVIVIVHSTDSSPKKPRGTTVHQDVADTIVAVWCPEGIMNPHHVEMTKYRQHRDKATGTMSHQMNPVVIGKPDPTTHLVDLDISGMNFAGMSLPRDQIDDMFTDMDAPINDPDTNSEAPQEEDDFV